QDSFQSLFQQRIVSRGLTGSSSSQALNRAALKAQVREARPSKSTSPLLTKMQNLSSRSSASKQQEARDPIPLNITRKLINRADKAQNQDQSSSTETTQTVDSSSQSWKANLRSRALRLAQGTSQKTTQAGAVAVTPSQVEMPPALKALMEFLNQQPGQALKVPSDRLPEVEAFLLKAGLPAEQVQNLLSSPRFQELGLTAADVQSAWQKAAQNALQESVAALDTNASLTSGQVANLQTRNIASQSDYQQMWQNLTLPAKALPDLRLELQQMGVPAETLVNLNEQNFPQGITLTQVWQLIQQVPKSPAATAAANDPASNTNPGSPLLLNGGKDMEKWRQLLVQSGMDPELAQTLTSASTPTNQEELRTGLLKMAPPPNPPSDSEVPKPLYLPESVRVRAVPLLQQQPNAGQGGSGDGGNLAQNFGFSPQAQEANLSGKTDLNNFLALLNSSGSLEADQAVSSGGLGTQAQSVNALLTPEAREALWSQVQNGILGNLRPGENQITLTLNPPEMGKLHLTLNVKGEMVEVTAVTSHPAVAEAGTAGVQQLAQALSQQGLILTQFQFHHQDEAAKGQTEFAFSQTSGDQRQTGKKDDTDKWEQPTTPRRQRWAGGIDCFA
ncbi:MAG: flagellar hook-length control protein FliK, partial [Deltaproteobacteria bacterium]|nr:flagellar hook-length control protein FliK [Deltaproteobacteria bacterium]